MTTSPPTNPPPLPTWVVAVGSVLIAFHLFALGIMVLAAPSGPWITNIGPSPALGPMFAGDINRFTGQYYLRSIHMTHAYHFSSNAPESPSVKFEVRLKDVHGRDITTLRFPSDNANYWVRHRQRLLAEGLGNDQPVQPLAGENIPPPGQAVRRLMVWFPAEGDALLRLTEKTELEIPKDRPVSRPANYSLILAKAYVRHLCRQNGAASGELIRQSRNAIHPTVLFMPDRLPPDTFMELACSFGEYRP
jgi:hypothetical protein